MSEPGLPFTNFSVLVAMALWTSLAVGSELLSDPTRPPVSIDVSTPLKAELRDAALELRAIFFADGRRVAIINEHRVQEQDVIGSARVLEIGPTHVRLRRRGRNFDLKLVRRDIKRKPGSTRKRADASPMTTRPEGPSDPNRPSAPELEGKPE